MKKKLYFADLTYTTGVVSTDSVPLGCGYVAAYTKSLFGSEFDISLFKFRSIEKRWLFQALIGI